MCSIQIDLLSRGRLSPLSLQLFLCPEFDSCVLQIMKAWTECSRTLDCLTYGILGFSPTTEIRDSSVIETVNLFRENLLCNSFGIVYFNSQGWFCSDLLELLPGIDFSVRSL